MVRSKDEIMDVLKEYVTSDDDGALAFMEDIADTLDTIGVNADEAVAEKEAEMQKKLDELDASWRERYKARFFEPSGKTDESDETHDKGEPDEPSKEEIIEELVKEFSR